MRFRHGVAMLEQNTSVLKTVTCGCEMMDVVHNGHTAYLNGRFQCMADYPAVSYCIQPEAIDHQ